MRSRPIATVGAHFSNLSEGIVAGTSFFSCLVNGERTVSIHDQNFFRRLSPIRLKNVIRAIGLVVFIIVANFASAQHCTVNFPGYRWSLAMYSFSIVLLSQSLAIFQVDAEGRKIIIPLGVTVKCRG